jgi:hypothetical protein
MFRITDGKGFQMTFDNGWTVSVQFGYGNYCENRQTRSATTIFDTYTGKVESPTAEIAAWKGDQWYDFGDDNIKGWVAVSEAMDFIEIIRRKI